MKQAPKPDLTRIQGIEACAFHAWPAPQTERHGDWLLRLAGGFTKRANSANPGAPDASFEGVQAAAEALYGRHGLPAIFRITPLASPEADVQLASAGYVLFDPSCVMTRVLEGAPESVADAFITEGVTIALQPTDAWLDGFSAANGVSAQHQGIHHAMLRSIAHSTGFATLHHAGDAIGFGLAVREGDALGFYDIVIDPAHRNQGHGATLMRALMGWGIAIGARWAYLQVREENPAARALYAGLGFADLYRYHYRVPGAAL
ncbi:MULTISPECIES: GNAT family N-acetyltransferase [unclassified Acidovorax]|uniref:GNAT family N-acetyltransferase n=1 Tax=unclassified Acidovorax TaxID=2684926 RepID=UPI0028831E72|nr:MULTISPECIES: GNAT family N-acetyltransferase [unclassified Acidovorax]